MSFRLGSAASSPGGAFHTSAVSMSAVLPSSGETRTSSSGIAALSAADHAIGSSRRLENNNAPVIPAPYLADGNFVISAGAAQTIRQPVPTPPPPQGYTTTKYTSGRHHRNPPATPRTTGQPC